MPWYNTSWPYRIPLTVDHTKVSGTPTDHPVFVDLANMGASFWSHVLNGGADIRITTSDGTTEVAREVVRCDAGSSAGEVHFKASALSSSVDDVFYLYYGNSGASEPASNATYGRNAVWSTFIRVFHLNEASGSAAVDSSGNGNGTYGAGLPDQVAAKVGYGQNFGAASTDNVNTGRAEGATWTWESWINPDVVAGFRTIICVDGANYLLFDISGNSLSVWSHDGLGNNNLGMSSAFSAGTDYYVAVTRSGNSTTGGYQGWKDGVNTGSANSGTWSVGNNATIGARPDTSGQEFDGKQSEVRFSTAVRGQSYFLTTRNNLNSPATFLSVGSEQTSGNRRRRSIICGSPA